MAGLVAFLLAAGYPAIAEEREAVAQNRELLRRASSWTYQLQDVNADNLARTDFDVLVVDLLHAGSADRRDVARLKRKPDGGRRVVLAYVNIGEAEDYRYYWKRHWARSPPHWMGRQNCRWKGDHRVRHWSTEWQSIIFGRRSSYLGRLIAAGFDGAWLDRVDIHRYWAAERTSSFAEMVSFVSRLSAWAKGQRPDFLIVPQNGEELLADAGYRAAIDGLGKEDLFFGDHGNDRPNEPWRVEKALSFIKLAQRDGLPVLAVEYARDAANRQSADARHRREGFIPYLGPRSLAYIGPNTGRHAEDGDSEPLMDETRADDGC